LHADVKILVEFEKVETWNWRLGNVDLEFRRLESALALTFLPRSDEFVDDALGFADHTEIRRHIAMWTRTHVGAADNDGQAAGAAHVDEIERIGLLKQHAARHHHVGPGEIALGELLGVTIDQSDVPGFGQKCCDRDQAKRNGGIPRADKLAGFGKIPEGIRHKPRIDHEHVASGGRPQSCDVAFLLFQESPTPCCKAQCLQYGRIER